jgi:hypothetical protein
VHHTFTHAKALATVLDLRGRSEPPSPRVRLARDEPYGLRHFPEIGTWLASVGDWRATFTEYDWEYRPPGGGHPSGGSLSLLHHQRIGPVLVASMTEYQLWEAHNQQVPGDWPTMPLTPRIDVHGATSLNDFEAMASGREDAGEVVFDASGRLLTVSHADPPGGAARCSLRVRLTGDAVHVEARSDTDARLVLPIVCTQAEAVSRNDGRRVHVQRERGRLLLECAAPSQLAPLPERRVFNLVPGFQCVPIVVPLAAGRSASVSVRAEV